MARFLLIGRCNSHSELTRNSITEHATLAFEIPETKTAPVENDLYLPQSASMTSAAFSPIM
jgi:hypothetical protein